MITGSVGTDIPQFFTHPSPLMLESGEILSPVTIAYETYGSMNGITAMPSSSAMPCPGMPMLRGTTRERSGWGVGHRCRP